MTLEVKTRWVVQRPDGKFVCNGGVWGYNLGEADMWVDEQFAKRASELVGGDSFIRRVRISTEAEFDDETTNKEEKQ